MEELQLSHLFKFKAPSDDNPLYLHGRPSFELNIPMEYHKTLLHFLIEEVEKCPAAQKSITQQNKYFIPEELEFSSYYADNKYCINLETHPITRKHFAKWETNFKDSANTGE